MPPCFNTATPFIAMLARLLKRPVCRLLASRSMAMSAEEKSEIAAKVAADKVVVGVFMIYLEFSVRPML